MARDYMYAIYRYPIVHVTWEAREILWAVRCVFDVVALGFGY